MDKKIVKYILGFLILLNIMPCIAICTGLLSNGIEKHGYLLCYLHGWIANVAIVVMVGLVSIILWCFKE